jgi:hypothetical protein
VRPLHDARRDRLARVIRGACLAVAVAALALAAGCGGDDDDETTTTPSIDPAAIEPQLLENLAADAGVDPSGDELDCPRASRRRRGTSSTAP